MIIVRYYCWLIIYTMTICHKLSFKSFLRDLVNWPTHVFDGLMETEQERKELILQGMARIKNYWSYHDKPAMPPAFVVKKLLRLEAEARS